MPRHCIIVRLKDGSSVSLQFSHVPTEAEIKAETESTERLVEQMKKGSGSFTRVQAPKDEYP